MLNFREQSALRDVSHAAPGVTGDPAVAFPIKDWRANDSSAARIAMPCIFIHYVDVLSQQYLEPKK